MDPQRTPPLIWLNAGEPSGDQHGGLLMRAISKRVPLVRFTGMGGQSMRSAGLSPVVRSEDLSVMGLTEVLAHLPRIVGLLRRIRRELALRRPDLVVLIDAPDFNFRVARMAHGLGIPVVYYISPQIWAWRQSRVRFIKRYVARVISILPFEQEFYARHGVAITYVGHPLVDATTTTEIKSIAPDRSRIAVLPGSRRSELESLVPVFGEAARILLRRHPSLTFHIALAPTVTEAAIRSLWPGDVPVTMADHSMRYAMLRSCFAAMAASGTVTLESGLLGTPAIVAYRFSKLTAAIGRLLIKVKYASLTNLILDEEVFPEFLLDKASPEPIAERIDLWLSNPAELEATIDRLRTLSKLLGPPGAVGRAAEAVLDHLPRG
jgi:lipid-A-disaccharide synthase